MCQFFRFHCSPCLPKHDKPLKFLLFFRQKTMQRKTAANGLVKIPIILNFGGFSFVVRTLQKQIIPCQFLFRLRYKTVPMLLCIKNATCGNFDTYFQILKYEFLSRFHIILLCSCKKNIRNMLSFQFVTTTFDIHSNKGIQNIFPGKF